VTDTHYTTRHPPLRIDDEECQRLAAVMEVVGRRWSSGILLALGMGAERYSEIERRVHGLSGRMLTVRLRRTHHARQCSLPPVGQGGGTPAIAPTDGALRATLGTADNAVRRANGFYLT
jgi:hypothetical protein